MGALVGAVLLEVEHLWECPSCDLTGRSTSATPDNKMHPCPGLGGLLVPVVAAGVAAEHRVNVREDYLGDARTPMHEGAPVMSVQTRFGDGQEACTIYVPAATNVED